MPQFTVASSTYHNALGKWIVVATCYANNFSQIKELLLDIDDTSKNAVNSKALLKLSKISNGLTFIKSNYSFIPQTLLKLEKEGMSLCGSLELIKEFENSCAQVKGRYCWRNSL